MKVLVIGAGGVGSAFTGIAQRRPFFDQVTLADLDAGRAETVVERLGSGVLGPESFAAAPFLERMRAAGWNYGIAEGSTADVV